MKRFLSAWLIWTLCFFASGVSYAQGALPPAPGSYSGCEVLSYRATSGSSLLSATDDEVTESWVVRSPVNPNTVYAVTLSTNSSGRMSMCAYTPNRVLATLASGKSYSEFLREMEAKGLKVIRKLMEERSGNSVYIVESEDTETDLVQQMTASIQSTGFCTRISPDHIYEASAIPNDAYYSSQWALESIGAPKAWDSRTDASSVVVAVLDTGVNYNHYDLNSNLWINEGEIPGDGIDNDGNGYVDDVYGVASIDGNPSGNPMDDNGHGSHCAGIIGAAGNNRQWISGVVWKASIMGLKFLDSEGRGKASDAITCLAYAEEKGVKVVNCSFGESQWNDYLYEQMLKMSEAGTVFTCAAGNANPGEAPRDNDEYPLYPANYPVDTIISVAACDENNELANFSYYGAENVDIAAPGVNIYSTVLGTYGLGYKDGTSMATPHVTGALALLMAHYPDESSTAIINRLYAAAKPVHALNGKVRTGATLSLEGFFGLPAPVEISVTQGTDVAAVGIYWSAVTNGTHYRVWRASEDGGEKTMLCDWRQGLTYTDETAEPGVTYWYYIQAASSADGASASPYSMGISGFRPEVDLSKLTVSFNAGGGIVGTTSKVYTLGETYAEFPIPTSPGKVFLGWFTAPEGGTKLDSESYVRDGVTTLYARWIDAEALRVENLFARQRYPWNGLVDITFNLSGVPDDETVTVSLIAQEEGGANALQLKTFVGETPAGLTNGAQHVIWNATADVSAVLYENMVLTATVTIDEKPLVAPGSLTATNGTDASAVTLTWSASENATSYEVWRATTNSVASASRITTGSATSFTDTSAVPGVSYWYWVRAVNDKSTSEYSTSVNGSRKKVLSTIAIAGNSSVTTGANASYTCTVTYNDNKTATVIPTWRITSGSSYATISSAGLFSAYSTAVSRSVTISASYTYGGVTKTTTKTITINTKSVTVTFNANGGTVSPTSKSYTAHGTYSTLPTPTRTNYIFAGWFTAASGGTQVTTSSVVPASATTLYAHWNAQGPQLTIKNGVLTDVSLNGYTTITIPNTVTSIGNYAFADCTTLTSVTIPESVTSIGWYAFSNCASLTSITIPKGTTSIGSGAFDGCTSLSRFYVDSSNTTYKAVNGFLLSKSGFKFLLCPLKATSATIPSGVTEIAKDAFNGCSKLTSVTIPESVMHIGSAAFCDCASLTSITLPSGITKLEFAIFSRCSSLKTVSIPESVTCIEGYAFNKCTSLTSVTISQYVTTIEDHVFDGCTSLVEIDVDSSNTAYKTVNSLLLNKAGTTLLVCPGGMRSATVPSGVTTIGRFAFYFCTSLTNVTLPTSVTTIQDAAFSDCTSLTSLTIPENLTNIGEAVFFFCDSLKSFYVNSNNTAYKAVDGCLLTKDGKTLVAAPGGATTLTIPSGVTRIGAYSVYGCRMLTSVTFPKSVTSAGYYAFNSCLSLISVKLPSSLKGTITKGTFCDSPDSLVIEYYD